MKWSVCIAIAAMFIVTNARAQFGVELSGSYNIQNGTYVAPCGCTFANGNGLGYMAAASMDFFHFLGLTVGVKPGYEMQQFTSNEVFPASLTPVPNGDKEDIKINLLSLEPFVRYDIPSTGVFVQASPSFKYVLSSSFHHNAGSAAGEEGGVSINPDSAITLKSALYNAKGTIGYSTSLLGIQLEPSVSAAFPITNLSDITDAKNWAVTILYLTLGVRL